MGVEARVLQAEVGGPATPVGVLPHGLGTVTLPLLSRPPARRVARPRNARTAAWGETGVGGGRKHVCEECRCEAVWRSRCLGDGVPGCLATCKQHGPRAVRVTFPRPATGPRGSSRPLSRRKASVARPQGPRAAYALFGYGQAPPRRPPGRPTPTGDEPRQVSSRAKQAIVAQSDAGRAAGAAVLHTYTRAHTHITLSGEYEPANLHDFIYSYRSARKTRESKKELSLPPRLAIRSLVRGEGGGGGRPLSRTPFNCRV